MPSGLLEVRGTVAFDQFWPSGTSDADTTKILVRVERDGFRFRKQGGELHYRPPSALARDARSPKQHAAYLVWNHEYRQPLAETGTVALRAFLADTGRSPVPCVVRTQVDEPGEVFDTYGRFVGDIHVVIGDVVRDARSGRGTCAGGSAEPEGFDNVLEKLFSDGS